MDCLFIKKKKRKEKKEKKNENLQPWLTGVFWFLLPTLLYKGKKGSKRKEKQNPPQESLLLARKAKPTFFVLFWSKGPKRKKFPSTASTHFPFSYKPPPHSPHFQTHTQTYITHTLRYFSRNLSSHALIRFKILTLDRLAPHGGEREPLLHQPRRCSLRRLQAPLARRSSPEATLRGLHQTGAREVLLDP